jgi:RNA polymerase sigma-70 factor (ECF subfamily)
MADRDPFANPEELLRRVYAYVAYRVGNQSDAEDITSETFERALRYRDGFDERKGEPVAWLLGIARNCVYDALLRPRERAADEEVQAAHPDVEAEVVGKLALMEALATLSPSDRELLALRYGADLSPREIGRLLDHTRNAVDVALSRARTRLAAALQRAEEQPRTSDVAGLLTDLADRAL